MKAIAAVYGDPPHTIYYNAERGISEPKDLEGQTLADSAHSAIRLLWPVFAEANDIDMDKVNWNVVDPTAVNPSILGGSADGIGQFTISAIGMQREAEELGLEIGRMRYVDHGLSFYGNSLLAHESTIADNPDLVRRFVAATIKVTNMRWRTRKRRWRSTGGTTRTRHPTSPPRSSGWSKSS